MRRNLTFYPGMKQRYDTRKGSSADGRDCWYWSSDVFSLLFIFYFTYWHTVYHYRTNLHYKHIVRTDNSLRGGNRYTSLHQHTWVIVKKRKTCWGCLRPYKVDRLPYMVLLLWFFNSWTPPPQRLALFTNFYSSPFFAKAIKAHQSLKCLFLLPS